MSYSMGTLGPFSGGTEARLTTHLHLVLRLIMNKTKSLPPLYSFMAYTGTTLTLKFSSLNYMHMPQQTHTYIPC